MADIILKNMGLHAIDKFETIHNYVDIKNGIVRKGAVKADMGEMLIIPINMRDGSLLCMGKGNEDWLCSAPHGAGRLLSRSKAKELLAICVDRNGGVVKMEEAIDKLWEGSPFNENVKTRYRKAVAYLHAVFMEYAAPNVFISGYGSCYIAKENVACDYFEFLDSDHKPQFYGEFMHEYSWAEETAARLEMQRQRNKY
jgi:hypothetical protein